MRLHAKHMVPSRSLRSPASRSTPFSIVIHSKRLMCLVFSPAPPVVHSAVNRLRSDVSKSLIATSTSRL